MTQSTSVVSLKGSSSRWVITCSHISSARCSSGGRPWRFAKRCARVRYSDWMSTAESSRPLASRMRRRHDVSWLISRMARIGFSSVRSRHGAPSSSSMRRMIEVAPTLRNVAYSLMFESPTITCRRRNRSASAWGSSRVLMIGRERVVALETPSQMCSARCAMQYIAPRAGLEHLARARVDLAGHEERDQHVGELGEVAFALDEIVLVAAVGVAGAVGVVLEEEHLAADALLAQALLGALHEAFEDALAGLVVHDEVVDRVALRRGVLGMAADVEVQPRRRSRGTRCWNGPTRRRGGTSSGRPRRGSGAAGRGACR